jgi:hypothetical protein
VLEPEFTSFDILVNSPFEPGERALIQINEQEMLSDEEISALREKNAYLETNVQDIEPRATADTRIYQQYQQPCLQNHLFLLM